MTIDKKRLLEDLIEGYRRKHGKSEKLYGKAGRIQIRGGSHNLRLYSPFPFYDASADGSTVTDIDGNRYIDFWQGHFGNILGHNPRVVIDAMRGYLRDGQGLMTGFPGRIQEEFAELILGRIYGDKIRFTTSGTLSTMYAVMLARAFTKRELVMKVGGGWHGSQPFTLKGIFTYRDGFDRMESAGLPPELGSKILVTRFNDTADLEGKFKDNGGRIACFIVEPFIGSGGFIFSEKEYLRKARELTERHGAVLIFDEVISGFRFHAGGVQRLYGIEPDLSVFGKAIGGGMPVSAVAGRDEIMALCDPETEFERRVKFEGGTYSAHPASMMAGKTFIEYLIEHEKEIYPRIGRLGGKVRSEIEHIFSRHGFNVRCSGGDDSVTTDSSIVGVHFVNEGIDRITCPDQTWNPDACDIELRESILKLAMLDEGFNIFHGYGAISAAHSEGEVQSSLDAVERVAVEWEKYR
jgi:glutamate-1-semialdehyde 2,1-aminomutase